MLDDMNPVMSSSLIGKVPFAWLGEFSRRSSASFTVALS